ncbi:hypothetical protein DFH06DRAFT_724759 [Mycena polygramma]|nr:hypothetical protein DFH06DRAFT_724759 [Mycena polygramma]
MSWLRVQCISSTVIVGTVDFVLMCRVWMLYGRPRSFLWLFGCMVIAEIFVMLGHSNIFLTTQSSLVTGCYAYNAPRFLAFTAGAPAVVTSVMFAMTVYKCTTTLTRISHHGMPTWKLFLRDGVFWFLAVFIAAAAELSVWATHRESLKEVLAIPALVVYSVVSSRALLNIKELMATDLEADATETDLGNTIVFASPVDSSC